MPADDALDILRGQPRPIGREVGRADGPSRGGTSLALLRAGCEGSGQENPTLPLREPLAAPLPPAGAWPAPPETPTSAPDLMRRSTAAAPLAARLWSRSGGPASRSTSHPAASGMGVGLAALSSP